MKKHKGLIIGLIIAGVVLAVLAAYCFWYTHVPKSWADIDGVNQPIHLSNISLYLYADGDTTGHHGLPGSHPAAQAIISALENHTYQADLVNLNPIPQDPVPAPEVDSLSLMMSTPEKRITVAINSNGQFYTDIISSSPRCYSYQTDTDLFQEVLDILHEYGVLEENK